MSSDGAVKPEITSGDSGDDVTDAPRDVTDAPCDVTDAPPAPVTKEAQPEQRAPPMRSRRKNKLPRDAHKVTFTVTIAKAMPTLSDDDLPDVDEMMKKKKKVFDVPRAQSYYHTEYQLLPTETEPVKTDVVMFGMAAKIYADKQDPKVVKTWVEGDKTWIAWTLTHSVQVTSELLKKLHRHTLQLRIWDTRDKCSTRAKFDRPKAFRLPQSKEGSEDSNSVRGTVLQQAQAFVDGLPKQTTVERPLPAQTPSLPDTPDAPESRPVSEEQASRQSEAAVPPAESAPAPAPAPMRPVSPTPNTLMSVPNRENSSADPARTYSRLGRLAGMAAPVETKPKSGSRRAPKPAPAGPPARSPPAPQTRKSPPARTPQPETLAAPPPADQGTKSADAGSPASAAGGPVIDPTQTRKSKKNDPAAQLMAEHYKKHGVAMIPIRMAEFYAGRTTITNRLESSAPSLEDVFITVSVNEPLLSPEQTQMLNPLILTVQTAQHMPSSPISHDKLAEICHPVTCKYKLFKQPEYQTVGRRHGRHIHFNDINVFLLGTMDDESLREYLSGPLMEIELHDRDRRPVDAKLEPALFGDELEDEKISNVGVVTSRRTTNNPFTDRGKHWDPYGLAKFDLTGLLRGERVLMCSVPVQPCTMPDLLGGDKPGDKLVGLPGAVDGPAEPPLPAGDYLSSGTTLKLRLDLSLRLDLRHLDAHSAEAKCPFGRLVLVFSASQTSFLVTVHQMVTRLNARALSLGDMPEHVMQLALSTYKLTRSQQTSRDLDLLTGFHVMDGVRHVVILEGLTGGALQQFWTQLPRHDGQDLSVYYNAGLTFSDRLYATLDVDLTKIKLHEPLDNIVQRSLLYVRDIVPKPCFQALTKIHQLVSLGKLKDMVRNDVFPSADMVQSMSKEFGVPVTGDDFEESSPDLTQSLSPPHASRYSLSAPVLDRPRRTPLAPRTPLDNHNPDFMQYLQMREEFPLQKDHISGNKADVKCQSAQNHLERTRVQTVRAEVQVPHNYSSQALNSTELAKEKLRNILKETPETRYTYCPTYHHSMTVVPVNVPALKAQEKLEARSRWKTESGWKFPGMRPAVDNNQHPLKPHPARVDQLHEEWRENTLHAAVLNPTLPQRDVLTWPRRHSDFNTWTRPEGVFDPRAPVTIHLAGDLLEEEQFSAAARDYQKWSRQKWSRQVCVDSLDVRCHRCLPATEMTNMGAAASNQLSRLEGLLKDPARKHGIRYPGIHHVPSLHVVNNPSLDPISRKPRDRQPRDFQETRDQIQEGRHGFGPGPFMDHSWTVERNAIPLRSYQHDKFAASKGHDFNVYNKDRSALHQPTRDSRDQTRGESRGRDHVATWNLPREESYRHVDCHVDRHVRRGNRPTAAVES